MVCCVVRGLVWFEIWDLFGVVLSAGFDVGVGWDCDWSMWLIGIFLDECC